MGKFRVPRASSRAAILSAFAERVAERGYSDTSIADVAAMLGLSKGTIVHHFGSKEKLLSEVHAAYFERRFAEAEFVLRELDDPVSQLAAMIYALLAGHRDDRAASLTFLREFVRYVEGGLSQQVRDQRLEYRQMVIRIIEDGVKQEVFVSSDPTMAAMQIFGMCNYAWTWYRPDGSRTVEQIATYFARTILTGLACTSDPEAFDELIATAIETVQRAPGRLPPNDTN
ncbi:AcrR family transcriptional regulator [Mycobacterium sp. MAA66]|uniref:TetR family transcriptional regulator n=1 Tax=Mycobacterium sp. MAA66 TaxID=3156297 RepID=UPI0035193061